MRIAPEGTIEQGISRNLAVALQHVPHVQEIADLSYVVHAVDARPGEGQRVGNRRQRSCQAFPRRTARDGADEILDSSTSATTSS